MDEETLSAGCEEICAEMELEDEEAKDFVQRQRSQWKGLASHPDRGRIRVEQSVLAESWNPPYATLGFDPDAEDPPFLEPAVSELGDADGLD